MLEPTTDPGEVGLDDDRLARIDALTHGSMTQLLPSSTYPVRGWLRATVHGALLE